MPHNMLIMAYSGTRRNLTAGQALFCVTPAGGGSDMPHRIVFRQARFRVSTQLELAIEELELRSGDMLVLLGSNGAGKSLLARALCGTFPLISGTAPQHLTSALVSLETQQQLFEEDYRFRNSDTLRPDEEHGITVRQLLSDPAVPDSVRSAVCNALQVGVLLERAIGQLSGGEGRRVLLARALCQQPQLLVLDTPFEALDTGMRRELLGIIEDIHRTFETCVVLIVNRADEIPLSANLMGIIAERTIVRTGPRAEIEADAGVAALLHCRQLEDVIPPPPLQDVPVFAPGTFIALRHLSLSYEGRSLFSDLTLELAQGEHCLITGPNGAGKSSLLSFITGDNPLVYVNDVTVFGCRRGSGESIWDIKKHYGLVSGALHLDYRVSAPVISVIVSGLYDSIGMYRRCTDAELELARSWLEIIGLQRQEHSSFRSLSFGQQRLVLIARALIKGPALLILDEPLQGLDALSRALVRDYVSYFMHYTRSTVIFVSHHPEDAPGGFVRHLEFVPQGGGGCRIVDHVSGGPAPAAIR